MNKKTLTQRVLFILVLICLTGSIISAQTTEFTYQGKLTDTGTPAATYDFNFRLYGTETGGAVLGAQQRLGVTLANGVFTVKLDFGVINFSGANRWMEIDVKRSSDANFTTLQPRQQITSAPYAVQSLNATLLGGFDVDVFQRADGDGSGLTNVAKLDDNNVFTGSNNFFPKITLTENGEIFGLRLQNSGVNPADADGSAGRVYFNTQDRTMKISNGEDAWETLAPRRVTTSSGIALTNFSCNNVTSVTVHSIPFVKSSAASRLKVSYSDLAYFRIPETETKVPWVEVRIDGNSFSPAPLRHQFFRFEDSSAGTSTEYTRAFTIFGYAANIPAGAHTLTVQYLFQTQGNGTGRTCYRGYPFSNGNRVDDPFHIEIEEIP